MGQNPQNCTPSISLESQLTGLKAQLDELEVLCNTLSTKLREAQDLAVAKQFEVTKLNNPSFFQRNFTNLRKKQDAAWAVYRSAVTAADELKMELASQKAKLEKLRKEYNDLISLQ